LSLALLAAQERLAGGERSGQVLCDAMRAVVQAETGVELDYAAVADAVTLEPVTTVSREARALIAARLEGVRLIDNVALVPPSAQHL
jgi:pantoate--beta-alanine ligase